MVPASMRAMMRVKSADRALREHSSVPSGRWNTGWRKRTSSVVMPTKTSRPAWATSPKAFDIEVLLEAELAREVQLAGGDKEARTQPAITVDAECLVLLAAVRVPAPAGMAGLAVDVGLDGAVVSRPDVRHSRADLEHLDAEFMAG